MLNQLYKLIVPRSEANKFNTVVNRLLGVAANILYPIYCFLLPSLKSEIQVQNNVEVIISLTSFPERIEKVYLCIESLLRQSIEAKKIILWLSKEQFANGTNSLPTKLIKLQSSKFEIRFVDEDIKSYKKIVYCAQKYRGEIIATVDDDVLYPENWLELLWRTYQEYPSCVICYRAHQICLGDKFLKYNEWLSLSPNIKGPDILLMPTGVGGVLYPPKFFEQVDFDMNIINSLCPTCDDLWLKVQGILNGFPVVKVFGNSKEWFTIRGSQVKSLMLVNTRETAKSAPFNDISWEKLDEYYNLEKILLNKLKEEEK